MSPGYGDGAGYVRRGDFLVREEALEEAREAFRERRSERGRALDKMHRVAIAKDVEKYKENTKRLDFPGVDTPRDEPRVSVSDEHHRATRGEGGVVIDPEDRGLGLLGTINEDTKYPEDYAENARDALLSF